MSHSTYTFSHFKGHISQARLSYSVYIKTKAVIKGSHYSSWFRGLFRPILSQTRSINHVTRLMYSEKKLLTYQKLMLGRNRLLPTSSLVWQNYMVSHGRVCTEIILPFKNLMHATRRKIPVEQLSSIILYLLCYLSWHIENFSKVLILVHIHTCWCVVGSLITSCERCIDLHRHLISIVLKGCNYSDTSR